jgi:hypothetical protein
MCTLSSGDIILTLVCAQDTPHTISEGGAITVMKPSDNFELSFRQTLPLNSA